MPFYEYRCDDCGEQVEVLQKMGVNFLESCSSCNGKAMNKLISASADVSSTKENSSATNSDIPPCMSSDCGGCPIN